MLYFDYNEYIKEGIYFMLIQDDALRSVIARTLRVKEEELNENGSLTLAHSQNSQMSFMYGFFFVKFLFFTVVCVVIVI